MEGSPSLNEDLLVEILAKVPVKALLRLRSVCKSWKSIIASPEFCSFHLSTNRHSSKILITARDRGHTKRPEERYFVLNNDENLPFDPSWLTPFDFPFHSHHIVASINGLICVSTSESDLEVQVNIPFMLWNPTIRRHVYLPDLTLTKPDESSIEFGYDPTTDDYKIVVLTLPAEFNVYSLNSNTWRRGFLDRQISLIRSTGAFAGGKMHWLVSKDFQDMICLYSFDVAKEVFAEVALPPQKDPAATIIMYPQGVTVLGDSLVVGQQALKSKNVMFDMTWIIWVQIVAGGWKKLYRVEDPMGMAATAFVCVLKNGELVMDKYYSHGSSYGIAAYDPKAREFKSFCEQRDFGGVKSLNDHQESLVLMDCTPVGDPRASCSNWSCQVQFERKTPSTLVALAILKSKN
ncbi:F-box and associated interaction domains-containing protein [Striga asiatica]|uniref:F-box and associated interaction domains-containing protein n=1 Tax=Striga asiatica TaxID=4170 RepID=A0A5A7QT46_STRAF|nr:F-box and associated interaction domains-containing protein [Striga asiatica]